MKIRVELRDRDTIDSALRRLRRLCTNAGIRRGRKAVRFYEKPGDRRRRAKLERLKTIRRAERERGIGGS